MKVTLSYMLVKYAEQNAVRYDHSTFFSNTCWLAVVNINSLLGCNLIFQESETIVEASTIDYFQY